MSDEDFDKKLKDIKLKQEESYIDRYYGVIVPTEWVAKIHNVSPRTVVNYVQRGLLPIVERTSSKGNYHFRLSEILKIDFDKLRKLI